VPVEKGNYSARYWRGQKERYSLVGPEIHLPNPGDLVVFQGQPFHLEDEGKTLRAFGEEEKRKFVLKNTSKIYKLSHNEVKR